MTILGSAFVDKTDAIKVTHYHDNPEHPFSVSFDNELHIHLSNGQAASLEARLRSALDAAQEAVAS